MNADREYLLSKYDFIVAVDASGSMGEDDMPRNQSRWDYMQETLISFVRDIQKIDSDGIGLVLFSGSNIQQHESVTVNDIKNVFSNRSPRGTTPLTEALESCLNLANKSNKEKKFILIFTDGVPDDQESAAQVIINATQSMRTDDELTMLFIQVGKDKDAEKYLKMLDNSLIGAKFDIVDAKTMAEAENFSSTVDLIINAIND